jgi:hypothetical protein
MIAVGVVVVWPRPERIMRENFACIQIGMSRAEVEALLGPPSDYRTGLGETGYPADPSHGGTEKVVWIPEPATVFARPNWFRIHPHSREELSQGASWMSDSFEIGITIDESGHVVDKFVYPKRTTQGPLDNILWRIYRQWHRWFPE